MGFGKDGLGVIQKYQDSITVGALAGGTAVKSNTILAITDDFRLIKSQVVAAIEGLTAGEGNFLLFGICNSDLTAAEIAAGLEAGGPLNRNDRDQQELAERFIRIMGAVRTERTPASEVVKQVVNEMGGPLLSENVRWTFSKGVGYSYFLYNYDNSTLTTGATLRSHVTNFGVWVS